jgi:hypothetical protein
MASTYSIQQHVTETTPKSRIARGVQRKPAWDLFIACAITLPVSTTIGLERAYFDGAIFMYVGEMWKRGVLPYVHLFDNKPPGIFILTAIASMTHHPAWFLALMEFLFVMGSILAARKTLQIMNAPLPTVFFGTIATALMVNLRFFEGSFMPEVFMLAPMAGSMLAFVCSIRSGKLRYVFIAGLCSGFACLFKPFGLSVFMAQIVYVTFKESPRLRAVCASILVNMAGAVAAWVPVSTYFALKGALKQMLDASFFYNAHYGVASQPDFQTLAANLPAVLLPLSTTIGCILIGLVALRKHPSIIPSNRGDLWNLTLLWFGFTLALVLFAGRGYKHYFISLTPSLGLAAALAFWSIEERESTSVVPMAFGALVLSPILMAHIPGWALITRDYQDVASHQQHHQWEIENAARELQGIAAPSSTVFVWGFEPWMLSYTHLYNAFRFPTSQYIYDSPHAYREVGHEILSGMQTTPPDYVVLTPRIDSIKWPHQSDPVRDQFMTIVQQSYTKVWDQDSFAIYKCNRTNERELRAGVSANSPTALQ